MQIVFEHPYYLILLLSIPLMILTHFYFLKKTKKKAMKFANFEALKRVTGEKLITKNLILLILRIVIIVLLIFGVSGPVLWYNGFKNSNDIVLAIDTSASMLTEDIKPTRLTAAKESCENFIDRLDSRTNIGIVSFAGVAKIESLLISNSEKLETIIKNLNTIPAGGTNIAEALVTSTNMLIKSNKGKVIILLTDGSQTTGGFVGDPLQAGINYVTENHIVVHTIGIGTKHGTSGYAPINLTSVYNKEVLRDISEKTGGKFYEAKNKESLEEVFNELSSSKSETFLDIDLRYGLVMISLILLFVEWGLKNTRFRAIP